MDGPKLSIFGPNLTARFALKIVAIERNKNYCGKTSAVELLKFIKIKALSLLPFHLCGLFLLGNMVRSQLKAVDSKFDKKLLSTQFLSTYCKKVLVPTFSSFGAIYHKGHFWKSLTQIFKFRCFAWYHAHIFEKTS